METQDLSAHLNDQAGGWIQALGLRFLSASADQVVAEWEVDPRHHQNFGIVHGGVHCSVIETVASVAAGLHAQPRQQSVVGLENHTSFIRAVRSGRLTCTAIPITRGRRTQLWEGTVRDEEGRVVATGRVRLLCLDPDTPIAGKVPTSGS